MSGKYKVIWTDIAEDDLAGIIEYIAHDSPSHARKLLREIQDKGASLYLSPDRGRIIPELQKHGILQYREIIISPWRIAYRIADRNVYILSVLDSRQNVEDILFKRLIRH
ncbi:MAG: type II toxin-antitoxin system RelE/ParE family toxin [bacterium]